MQYTKLGRTGLDVSRLCLGCMSYGGGNSGFHQWSLGEEESRPFIKKALEAGTSISSIPPIATRSGRARSVLGRARNERFRATRASWSSPPSVFNLMLDAPARMRRGFVPAKTSCSRSMRKSCAGSAPIMSTSTRSHRFDHETLD